MSHQIYTTRAMVLARQESGEGSCVLDLLTPEFGLVRAKAQGLRELKSKLRYSLQTYHQVSVSLVRGRELWRVVNAEPGKVGRFSHLPLVARVSTLLIRLVRGQEAHPELFGEFERAWVYCQDETLTAEVAQLFEIILVLRLLNHLGYVERRAEITDWLTFSDWSATHFESTAAKREVAVSLINQALHHSHL